MSLRGPVGTVRHDVRFGKKISESTTSNSQQSRNRLDWKPRRVEKKKSLLELGQVQQVY